MKILFVAPIPPPVTGNSLAVKILHDEIAKNNEVELVNFNKYNLKSGFNSLGRLKQIVIILKKIFLKKDHSDIIYFTISQSIAGNFKDIFIYLICFKRLPKMIIHLHGGMGMRNILSDDKSWIYKINRFFVIRLGAVIILGKSQFEIYSNIVPQKKLHIVPNFAEDYLFLNDKEIIEKFAKLHTIKFLFLSNFLEGKGFDELVSAFLALNEKQKSMIEIDFAGNFESEGKKYAFQKKIAPFRQLKYHGFVSGEQKKMMFERAHVFCLPTYYVYEGQPISILEAYAAGCFVITTNHAGIKDIFENGVNGFEAEKRSSISLKASIEQVVNNPGQLLQTGLLNNKIALEKYRTHKYNSSLLKIIETVNNCEQSEASENSLPIFAPPPNLNIINFKRSACPHRADYGSPGGGAA